MSIDVGNDDVSFEECSVADLLEVDDDRWGRVTAWRDELRRPLDDDVAQRHIWAAAACARHAQALQHHGPRPVRPLARLALASGVLFMGTTGLAAADILPADSVAGHVATVISAPLFDFVAPQPEPAPPAAPVAHAPAPRIPDAASTETSAPLTDPPASAPPSSIQADPAPSTIPTTEVPSIPAPSTSVPIPTTTAPSDGAATGQGSPPEPASSTTTTAPTSSTTTPSTVPASTTTTAPAGDDTATAQDAPGSTTSTPATSTLPAG
jgi:hypothetical protein